MTMPKNLNDLLSKFDQVEKDFEEQQKLVVDIEVDDSTPPLFVISGEDESERVIVLPERKIVETSVAAQKKIETLKDLIELMEHWTSEKSFLFPVEFEFDNSVNKQLGTDEELLKHFFYNFREAFGKILLAHEVRASKVKWVFKNTAGGIQSKLIWPVTLTDKEQRDSYQVIREFDALLSPLEGLKNDFGFRWSMARYISDEGEEEVVGLVATSFIWLEENKESSKNKRESLIEN